MEDEERMRLGHWLSAVHTYAALRCAARRVAALCVAARCVLKHCCVFSVMNIHNVEKNG